MSNETASKFTTGPDCTNTQAHTPGPWNIHFWENGEVTMSHGFNDGIWRFSGDSVKDRYFNICADKKQLPSSNTYGSFEGCHVCNIEIAYGDEAYIEATANARLIAAAPELLDALKTCFPFMHDLEYDNQEDRSVGMYKDLELSAAFKKMKAALAKATGK